MSSPKNRAPREDDIPSQSPSSEPESIRDEEGQRNTHTPEGSDFHIENEGSLAISPIRPTKESATSKSKSYHSESGPTHSTPLKRASFSESFQKSETSIRNPKNLQESESHELEELLRKGLKINESESEDNMHMTISEEGRDAYMSDKWLSSEEHEIVPEGVLKEFLENEKKKAPRVKNNERKKISPSSSVPEGENANNSGDSFHKGGSQISSNLKPEEDEIPILQRPLPPIRRKVFPNYNKGIIIPKCREIRPYQRRRSICTKTRSGACLEKFGLWGPILRNFYQVAKSLRQEVLEGRKFPKTEKEKKVLKTLKEGEAFLKYKMLEFQQGFELKLEALQAEYLEIETNPGPNDEELLENLREQWSFTKVQYLKEIEVVVDKILADIKNIYVQ